MAKIAGVELPNRKKGQKQGKGGGARKIGNNKSKCEAYRREGRVEKNKARRAETQAHREAKQAAKKARRAGQ